MAATYPFAFVFGIGAVIISYSIARIYKSAPTIMLILGGTITSSVFSSLISLMKYVADPETQLPGIVFWLMGSLSSDGWESFPALIPIAIGCVTMALMGWRINVLSMGDKEARTLGVNVSRDKAIVIAGASLATAGAVCMSGMIGWVGLVIPHIGRMIVGNDNRRLIPVSMMAGASFMMLIDLISRTLTPQEIPLGILTALVGAPFFVYLLKKTKGGGW
jgi:iron complex transport system permease protein